MPRTKRSFALEYAPDGRRVYSLGDVLNTTGATRARAEHWLKNAAIVPDYPASGSGNFHGFTFRNLVEFSVANALADTGLSLDAIRGALHGLRADDGDSYEEMPRMSAAVAAVTFNREPSHDEALAWVTKQERKYGVGGGRFTDPMWVAEANRYFPLIGMPEGSGEMSAAEVSTLRRWRRFKNPLTRGNLLAVLVCANHDGWLAFTAAEVWRWVRRRPGVTMIDLLLYFEALETKTQDSWDRGAQTEMKPDE